MQTYESKQADRRERMLERADRIRETREANMFDRYFTRLRIGDLKVPLPAPMTLAEIAEHVLDEALAPGMRYFNVRPAGTRTARVVEIHPDEDEAEYIDRM